jgi:hypothetical protein
VSQVVGADPGVDNVDVPDSGGPLPLLLGELLRPELTDSARARKQPFRGTERPVFPRHVNGQEFPALVQALGTESLLGNVGVDIRGGQDDVAELEHRLGIAAACPGHHDELTQGGRDHVAAAAVSDDVDGLELGARRQSLQELLEVVDRELTGLAIVGVAPDQARASRRPAVDDRHAFVAEKVPQIGHAERRHLQRVVVAVHEDEGLLAGRQREAPPQPLVQSVLGLLLCGEVLRCFVGHIALKDDRGRRVRKATSLIDRDDLQGKADLSLPGPAGLDKIVPGHVLADLHDQRATGE